MNNPITNNIMAETKERAKYCSTCKRLLPISSFHIRSRNYPDQGRQSYCKECVKKQNISSEEKRRQRQRLKALYKEEALLIKEKEKARPELFRDLGIHLPGPSYLILSKSVLDRVKELIGSLEKIHSRLLYVIEAGASVAEVEWTKKQVEETAEAIKELVRELKLKTKRKNES